MSSEVSCKICGTVFKTSEWRLANGRGKYCSRKCCAIGRYKKAEVVCKTCGKIVHIPSSDAAGRRGTYCSPECKQLDSRNRVHKKCDFCGKEIDVQPARVERSVRNYCSRICSDLGRMGENHPMWLGGVSFKPYCNKFNKQRKELVRNKFNRTCFLCGRPEDEKKLPIHHIDYNKNSICNGKSWPLIPLCSSCHSKTNFNRWYWFNLLINYWAMNAEIRFDEVMPYE